MRACQRLEISFFYLDVPANQVPTCHIAAVLHPLEIDGRQQDYSMKR